MKIQTLLFIILITNCVYCQEHYTFVTQNRDTLYLIDDPLGYSIKKTWEDKKLKDIKPVIIFKDYIWIEEKHKALKYEKVN